ncbi:restriction endonuclease subunit S [Bacillus paranthracis]|uniref:restriction endonuclease subunit S n=1 Tax=Bacillus paranthracis TaxID=2026186 RepID=UPI000D6D8F23|nr:restriction endonuclease subunit S [Bacillus paranthracis]PWN73301.1 restriction endonuclease [Bacillus cereus]PWN79072.1 restriction endonuclease [Bacillus cereus]UHJ49672.1 restriction endonuclease subunit S [Bacillus paranthracis]
MDAKQLKDSILQYAMQGKLVPQDPNDELAIELLKRIKAEKAQLIARKIIKKEKSLPKITEEEIPFEIPETWEWVRLGDLVRLINGDRGKNYPSKQYWINEGIPFINAGALGDTGIDINNLNYISEERFELLNNGFIEIGDILYCLRGSLGKAAINTSLNQGAIASSLVILRPYQGVSNEFVLMVLKSFIGKLMIQRVENGTAQPNLSAANVKNYLIPFPPLNEQNRIVRHIEKLQNKVTEYGQRYELKTQLDRQLPIKLEKSILQYAMQGQLVEQNPEDEPACQLVERIKTEKERLIKEKVIKQEKTLVEISEDEIPFDIPKTWEWMRVKDVCLINPRNKADDEVEAGFIPMKLIENGFKTTHTFEVQPWKEIKKGFTHFKNDDVVIAKITPCFENRKSVVIEGLPNNIGSGTTELYVVRPLTNEINNKFLLWLFKSHHFISNGVATYTGTAGQQRVAKSYVENYLIPIPPLNEQLRIVAALDKMHNNIKVLVN